MCRDPEGCLVLSVRSTKGVFPPGQLVPSRNGQVNR
jgi:hypothetical protein